jgi:four helix bundle protein
MPSIIIAERAFDFAVRIVKLCERLWAGGYGARRLANQLFDSGTSIAANAEEAQGGQTKADFIARLAIARKESRETVYWLRLAVRSGILTERDIAWELDEAQQLRKMITRAIHTAQTSNWRGGH